MPNQNAHPKTVRTFFPLPAKESTNDHAVELLNDLDYAHQCLAFINRQAKAIAAMLAYAHKLVADPAPQFPCHDKKTLIAMMKLFIDTIEDIQDRTAADGLVTRDDLLESLNQLDESLILKTPKYTLTRKGRVLSDNNLQGYLDAMDIVFESNEDFSPTQSKVLIEAGEYEVSRYIPHENDSHTSDIYWLKNKTGEGMSMSKSDMAEMLDAYFAKNF